jgi:enolase-phosphatase E1
MQTILVDRLQDYPQPRSAEAANQHSRVTSFEQIDLKQ